ncbi:MAG: hypothetical protein ACRBCJ_11365 [Hyphomicrobiaceae bacterium]
MRLKTPTPMQVIKKEEKEAKLSSFINDSLNETGNDKTTDTPKLCLIVARSQNSPVAQAASARFEELNAAGYVIQVIFSTDTIVDEKGAYQAGEILSQAGSCRVMKDHRLLDAHEQLVINGKGTWIGDSMRRDPLKIDAYECYAGANSDVAKWATSAFEKLWISTKNMRLQKPLAALETADEKMLIALRNEDAHGDEPLFGTRH